MTPAEHEAHPTVVAREVSLALPAPANAGDWERRLAVFLAGLAAALQQAGCPLIGHIKGVFDTGEGGQVFFSLTAFQQEARLKGRLQGTSAHAHLAINAIVYGIEASLVEHAVSEGLARHFGRPQGS